MRNKTQKGFTLIELLVVIAIIGLLASVVLLALNSARAKSRDAKRVADIRQLASALELYFNDANTYPVQVTAATTIPGLATTYIGAIPAAPTPHDNPSGGTTCTSTNNAYMYTGTATTYSITFCLGGVTGGLSAGTHTLSQAGIQ